MSLANDVEAHIRQHPRCTTAAIMEAFSINRNTASTTLSRLRLAGKIRRVFGNKLVRWELGTEPGIELADEEDHAANYPKQTTVSAWQSPEVRAQSWASALGL